MRWGDMRRSENVEDRGGSPGGGRRAPLGGGMKIGGGTLVVLVILSLVFGINPLQFLGVVACVLAQLSQSGQMVAVTAEQLQAYLTGVLSAQRASVTILNGVPTATVAGATFYVGYGTNGTAMIDGGINRSAVTVPGSLVCEPGPPQKGWWWNPAEDGRGFSLEVRGNNIFFAAFLYDVSGRSTWYVSTGPVSLDGSYYAGDLLSARGGQTLGGAYPGFPNLANVGRVTITFNNASALQDSRRNECGFWTGGARRTLGGTSRGSAHVVSLSPVFTEGPLEVNSPPPPRSKRGKKE